MAAVNAADRWIATVLLADVQLAAVVGTKVYADLPPQVEPPIALPFVIFTMLSGVTLRIVGPTVVWDNCLYKVVIMAEANSFEGTLKSGADRIDAVLHAQSGTNVSGTVYACVRESPVRLTEPPEAGGRVVRQLGGIYRLLVR